MDEESDSEADASSSAGRSWLCLDSTQHRSTSRAAPRVQTALCLLDSAVAHSIGGEEALCAEAPARIMILSRSVSLLDLQKSIRRRMLVTARV